MANQYTSYYLYQKYEKRGSQDWLPCYPNVFSVDGEGTMPLVIKTENDPECGYTPPTEPIYRWYNIPISQDYICDVCPAQYENQYLTFVAEETGTFQYYKTDSFSLTERASYSIDSGATWHTLDRYTDSPTINAGQKIMWKGEFTPPTYQGILRFVSTGKFSVEGNIMSLLFGDNFAGQTEFPEQENAWYFMDLFGYCGGLTSAENLVLPTMTLKSYCYQYMFYGCTSLTTAPTLSATTLADWCYYGMFSGCTSLNYIKCLATDISASYCTSSWVSGVSSSGTFVKPASTDWSSKTGVSGIPSNWAVQDA